MNLTDAWTGLAFVMVPTEAYLLWRMSVAWLAVRESDWGRRVVATVYLTQEVATLVIFLLASVLAFSVQTDDTVETDSGRALVIFLMLAIVAAKSFARLISWEWLIRRV